MPNAALQRIKQREPITIDGDDILSSDDGLDLPVLNPESGPTVWLPVVDPLDDDPLDDAEVETKDNPASTSVANTGALQGPLQGNESKGGAMSSPGVRGAAVKKKPPVPAKKPAPKKASQPVDQAAKAYIAPKPPAIWNRGKVGVVVTKGRDGRRQMMLVTSNSYRDREKEAVATKALQSYVEKAWTIAEDKCLPQNTLRFWHNGDIGDIVYADMEGPFLIEVAKERPNRVINVARPGQPPFLVEIKEVWDYLEENPDEIDWGASHGFKFYKGKLTPDGVYKQIYKFESSVLPLRWAANPYTFSGVVDVEPRDKLLQQLVGRANAKGLRQGVRGLKKTLDAKGVQHKAVKTEAEQPDEAEKGMLEDMQEKIGAALGEITDDPDKVKKLQDSLMAIIAGMSGSEPDGDEPQGTEADAEAGYQYDELDPETEGALSSKGLKLLDALIQTQETIAEDVQAIAGVQKAMAPIAALPNQVGALEKRLKALETQLKMRPQAASEADETVVEDDDLLAKVQKAMSKFDPFFGAHIEGE
jgi:hypothetical protein